MNDQNSIPVENGVLNFENSILVKKQGKDLGATIWTFCMTVACINGIDTTEETEILLEAAKALTAIDVKLGKSLDDQRNVLFENNLIAAEASTS